MSVPSLGRFRMATKATGTLVFGFGLTLLFCCLFESAVAEVIDSNGHKAGVARGTHKKLDRSKSSLGVPPYSGAGPSYQGGLVHCNPIPITVIWYGSWTPNSTTPVIVHDFLQGLSNSPYLGILLDYKNRLRCQ